MMMNPNQLFDRFHPVLFDDFWYSIENIDDAAVVGRIVENEKTKIFVMNDWMLNYLQFVFS
jgi:hypothetical protein